MKKLHQILTVALLARLIYFFLPQNVFWDGAVYVHMGKFLASGGQFGLWEPIRPLLWPILLGGIWKVGLDVILVGRLINIALAIGIIYLTYKIAQKVFGETTARIAALLLIFAPLFFLFSLKLYTGILGVFLGLLAMWFYLDDRIEFTFAAGLLLGLAFLTRFPLALLALALLIITIARREVVKALMLIAGFGFTTAAYFSYNLSEYGNFFYPLIRNMWVLRIAGYWIRHLPIYTYLWVLLKENFLLLLAFPALYLLLKEKKGYNIAIPFLIIFAFISFMIHKEPRYILLVLPFAAILAGYSLSKCKYKAQLLVLSIIISGALIGYGYYIYDTPQQPYEFEQFLDGKTGIVAVTGPTLGLRENLEVYPIYYQDFMNYPMDVELTRETFQEFQPDYLMINKCDMPCPPDIPECEQELDLLLEIASEGMEQVYHEERWCEFFIFER